jgi:hypothetical protein
MISRVPFFINGADEGGCGDSRRRRLAPHEKTPRTGRHDRILSEARARAGPSRRRCGVAATRQTEAERSDR